MTMYSFYKGEKIFKVGTMCLTSTQPRWVIQAPSMGNYVPIGELSSALQKIAKERRPDYNERDISFQFTELLSNFPKELVYVDGRYDLEQVKSWVDEILASLRGKKLPQHTAWQSFVKSTGYSDHSKSDWSALSDRERKQWATPRDQFMSFEQY